jgi:hypothetical protein
VTENDIEDTENDLLGIAASFLDSEIGAPMIQP